MYKYSQILGGKVHHIFEHEQPITVLRAKYFSPEIILIDITNNPEIQEGWYSDGITCTTPIIPAPYLPTKSQQLKILTETYTAKYDVLNGKYTAAELGLTDPVKIQAAKDSIKLQYQQAMLDYKTEQGVIIRG